ncbi:MAG: T9SS type A sorting domain-containing protein [Saprospirales bacterium]|nr:T9SS type A sorting domain-containing protein [Saprospirales bacterium]
MNLFPNPVHDILNISLNLHSLGNEINIQIISADGKVLRSLSDLEDPMIEIDLTNLPAGMYYVKVMDENLVWSEKIVKL